MRLTVTKLLSFNNQAGINSGTLKNVVIPVPSLSDQEKLVAQLGAARKRRAEYLQAAEGELANIDVYITEIIGIRLPYSDTRTTYGIRLKDINSRLDPYSNQQRFRDLLSSLQSPAGKLGLSSIALKDAAEAILSGTTPLSGGDAYTQEPGGIPFIRSGDIRRDGLVGEAELFLKPNVHQTSISSVAPPTSIRPLPQYASVTKDLVLILYVGSSSHL